MLALLLRAVESEKLEDSAEVVIQGHRLTNVETGVQLHVVPIPLSAER
jgi:hypothetical protein